jgi:hypothetical protein
MSISELNDADAVRTFLCAQNLQPLTNPQREELWEKVRVHLADDPRIDEARQRFRSGAAPTKAHSRVLFLQYVFQTEEKDAAANARGADEDEDSDRDDEEREDEDEDDDDGNDVANVDDVVAALGDTTDDEKDDAPGQRRIPLHQQQEEQKKKNKKKKKNNKKKKKKKLVVEESSDEDDESTDDGQWTGDIDDIDDVCRDCIEGLLQHQGRNPQGMLGTNHRYRVRCLLDGYEGTSRHSVSFSELKTAAGVVDTTHAWSDYRNLAALLLVFAHGFDLESVRTRLQCANATIGHIPYRWQRAFGKMSKYSKGKKGGGRGGQTTKTSSK